MTFEELQRQVYDLLGVTVPPWPLQVRAKALLNSAYLRVAAEHGMNQKRADLAFTAGDPYVYLPEDFLEVRSIRAGGVVLRMASDYETATRNAGDVAWGDSGDAPMVWAFANPSQIMLWPAPSESTPTGIDLLYTAVVAKMSSDNDVPEALPEPWHDLLAWMVVAQLGGSDQLRAQAIGMVNDLRGSLQEHTANRGGDDTSRIKLTGYRGR